jgi:hypothetical protein
MNLAAALRRELAERAQNYAQTEGLPHCLSYGKAPSVCFARYAGDSRHGNFLAGKLQSDKGKSRVDKAPDEGSHSRPTIPPCHRAGTLDGA